MRPSIIPKSLLNRRILTRSLLWGFLLWILLEVPLFFGLLSWLKEIETSQQANQRTTVESLLVESFRQNGRFGDLVNARGDVLAKGKPLGLTDIDICANGSPVLPRFHEEKCDLSAPGIHFIDLLGTKMSLGFVWSKTTGSSATLVTISLLISISLSLVLIFSGIFVTYFFGIAKIADYSRSLASIAAHDEIPDLRDSVPELAPLVSAVNHYRRESTAYFSEMSELKTQARLKDVARQVAHDIRSPVSALNLVVQSIDKVPENIRSIIQSASQRINDIANELLKNHSDYTANGRLGTHQTLSKFVNDIVIEKQVEFQSNQNVKIVFTELFGQDRTIDRRLTKIQSAVSNVINNAVEAIKGSGTVEISVLSNDQNFRISVRDNGIGMSSELVSRLGAKPISYGKNNSSQSGSGIGLYNAFRLAEELNGNIEIISRENIGSEIVISIPWLNDEAWNRNPGMEV